MSSLSELLVPGTKCLDDTVMNVGVVRRVEHCQSSVCCATVMDDGELTDCGNWVVTSLTTITGAQERERERSYGDIFSWHLVH